jgi:hypothetical protein
MIYMDPPHGVRFGSNFQPLVRKRDVKHNEDDDMTREPVMVKAYRDTRDLWLHSYQKGACPARGSRLPSRGGAAPVPSGGSRAQRKDPRRTGVRNRGAVAGLSVHLDSAAADSPLRPLTPPDPPLFYLSETMTDRLLAARTV